MEIFQKSLNGQTPSLNSATIIQVGTGLFMDFPDQVSLVEVVTAISRTFSLMDFCVNPVYCYAESIVLELYELYCMCATLQFFYSFPLKPL